MLFRPTRIVGVLTIFVLAWSLSIATAQARCVLYMDSKFCDGFEAPGLVLLPDSLSVDQSSDGIVDVLDNDVLLSADPVIVSIDQQPAHGTAIVVSDNRISYAPSIPNDTFLGSDQLKYKVVDQDQNSGVGVVDIRVVCPAGICSRIFVLSWARVNHPSVTGYCVYHDRSPRPDGAMPDPTPTVQHYTDRECVGDVTSYEWLLPVESGIDYFAVSALTGDQNESAYSVELAVESF